MGRKGRVKGSAGFTRNVGNYGKFKRTGELKFLDLIVNNVSAITTDNGTISIDSLNTVKQGTQPSERIGRKIFIKRLQIRGAVRLPESNDAPAGQNHGHRVRMIVYLDKQCNGAVAKPEDILQSTTTASGASVPLLVGVDSYRNMEFIDRFRVIYDKTWTINRMTNLDGTVLTPQVYKSFNMGKNMNLEVIYNTTDGTIGGIQSNNIGVMWLVDESFNNIAGAVELDYYSRIRFTD